MFYPIVTSLVLLGMVVYLLIRLNASERQNDALMRVNEQMRSHNRYLVARYGIKPQPGLKSSKHIISARGSDKVMITNIQIVGKPSEDDYSDGVAYPEQWKDKELEWNKEKVNEKTN